MPLLVHGVKAPEAKPNHSSVLVKAHVPLVYDDGAAGSLLGILASLVNLQNFMTIEKGQELSNLVDTSLCLRLKNLGLACREKFPLSLLGVLNVLGLVVHEIWAEY